MALLPADTSHDAEALFKLGFTTLFWWEESGGCRVAKESYRFAVWLKFRFRDLRICSELTEFVSSLKHSSNLERLRQQPFDTKPNMNTIIANEVEKSLGDRPTTTTRDYEALPNETMLALRWYGDKDVRVEEVPVPTITEPTDVVVRVTGTTVCGSDLHLYHKEIMQLQKGEILGHEFMGIVDEVGSEVTSINKGDRVVASF
jgi:hypothetical protein